MNSLQSRQRISRVSRSFLFVFFNKFEYIFLFCVLGRFRSLGMIVAIQQTSPVKKANAKEEIIKQSWLVTQPRCEQLNKAWVPQGWARLWLQRRVPWTQSRSRTVAGTSWLISLDKLQTTTAREVRVTRRTRWLQQDKEGWRTCVPGSFDC